MPKSLYALDAEFLSEEQARALAQRVLSFAKADETRVNITSGWSGNTRFAGNEITTSGGTTNTLVTVTSTIGRRRASSSTNILDDASLQRTVDLAERLAKLSPEDPEAMPELGQQTYAPVNGYFERTAGLTPEVRAGAVKRTIDTAEALGADAGRLFVAGFLQANAGASAVATSSSAPARSPGSTRGLLARGHTASGGKPPRRSSYAIHASNAFAARPVCCSSAMP